MLDKKNRDLYIRALRCARVAQLVERNLAKVDVASSSLVSRSIHLLSFWKWHDRGTLFWSFPLGDVAKWLRQGSAKARSTVRICPSPLRIEVKLGWRNW